MHPLQQLTSSGRSISFCFDKEMADFEVVSGGCLADMLCWEEDFCNVSFLFGVKRFCS